MLVWGSFAYLAALAPADLARGITRRLSAVRVSAVLLAVATTIVALPVEVAAIGDGWPDALDPATMQAVLIETSVGRAWTAQLVGAALLVVTLALPERIRMPATAVAAGLLLATLATQGHAVMQQGWIGAVHRANDALHVLAAGAWIGALMPLLLVLRVLDVAPMRRQAGTALRRFSKVGHGAVALVIATGVVNTALTLGRWPTDWSSPYQALLSAKIGVVIVMTALAVANRYLVVPRMAAREATFNVLRATTIAEMGLALAAILCVSFFGLVEPD